MKTVIEWVKYIHETGFLPINQCNIITNDWQEDHNIMQAEIDKLKEDQKELIEACQHIICKVNAVTAFHRHGNSIPKTKLDELSNYQIEFEHTITKIEQEGKGEM